MTEHEYNRTKTELLENISELFHKYGLRSTSMDDICTRLKISKKTLYQYFSNKDDLVEQVLRQHRTSRHTQEKLKQLEKLDSIECLIILGEDIIKYLNSQHQMNLFDLKKYHPEVYRRLSEEHQVFFYDQLTKVIEKGIRDGYFRKDIDKQVQIYLFAQQIAFLGEPEMMSAIKYPIDVVIPTIMENVIRSFVTSAGMEKLEKLLKNKKEDSDGVNFVITENIQKENHKHK